ncbi:MAG: TetR family transcriptional regulator [Demequinaceae bacterium]|nr:TetR family transcriptional regulator [Demequinaceae bacterium]
MPTQTDSPTRDRIVEAATDLVIERGYEAATMRDIAERAGVSLGSAYHYFRGKEELIGGIYVRIAEEHAEKARHDMAGQKKFLDRLEAAAFAYLDVLEPYRPLAEPLLALAIVPSSSLSPFSEESAPVRDTTIGLYQEVVDGSNITTDMRLLPDLPHALWLMHTGITLAWVHDKSEGQAMTREVLARSLPALDRMLWLGKMPLMRPLFNDAVEVLHLLRGGL